MATNELDLHNNKVAQLIEYGVEGSVRDVEFLYEDYRYDQVQIWQYIYFPTKNVRLKCSIFLPHRSCENNKIPQIWPCEKDPTMGDLSFRYYNITVTGTDSAGNVGSDNCKVIIMPNCFPKEAGCEAVAASSGFQCSPRHAALGDAAFVASTPHHGHHNGQQRRGICSLPPPISLGIIIAKDHVMVH